jgi:hypothetical protein
MIPLITTIDAALPGIFALLRANHAAANPGAPVPTSAEVIAAFESAVAQSLARGDAWLVAHPAGGGQ